MIEKNILIHCALLAEAKPLIGHFKLKKVSQNIYENDFIVLVVSAMGLEKTTLALKSIFDKYTFTKAFNIGICGCADKAIAIGEIFCTNHKLKDIKHASLKSFDAPVTSKKDLDTLLVDMEAQSFENVAEKFLHVKNIFVFKIVSDYLENTIPTKAFVNSLIQKNIKKILPYVQI